MWRKPILFLTFIFIFCPIAILFSILLSANKPIVQQAIAGQCLPTDSWSRLAERDKRSSSQFRGSVWSVRYVPSRCWLPRPGVREISRILRLWESVSEIGKCFQMSTGKPTRIGRPRCTSRLQGNIRIVKVVRHIHHLQGEIGNIVGNWKDSALDRDYWRVLVNAALNFQVPFDVNYYYSVCYYYFYLLFAPLELKNILPKRCWKFLNYPVIYNIF